VGGWGGWCACRVGRGKIKLGDSHGRAARRHKTLKIKNKKKVSDKVDCVVWLWWGGVFFVV
jgi:hypothetical protein